MGLKDRLNKTVDKAATKKIPFLKISVITLIVIIGLLVLLAPKNATLNGWMLKIPLLGGLYARLTKQTTPTTPATSTTAVNT